MLRIFISLLILGSIHSEPIKINLITTNDMHGVIGKQMANFMNPQYPPTIIGSAAFAKYIDQLHAEVQINGEEILVLDGGNIFQGSPLGMADHGQTMIEWMNRIGYDAMVPGSYDFISGAENLNELSKLANFPLLFSNLICNNCPLINSNIKPYYIRELSGIKVGVLGIVNSQLRDLALAENLSGTDADQEVLSARKWIPKMKTEGAELIILLTSSGIPWNREQEYEQFVEKIRLGEIDENSSLNALQMSYYLEDVDFVVSGGNSKGYWLPWYDPHSHVYVMQGYGGGTEFSHIKLLVDKESHLFMGYETVIDGKASQTLLADDFISNREDVKWIESKLDKSNKLYYSGINSNSTHTSSPAILDKNNWDFPNLNRDKSIEIITWNCEFFPHANDSTILALAEAVHDFNADIIAFQELRKTGWFSKLMAYLPEYDFIVSKQASFMDLAIIFKNDLFILNRQIEPFAENDYNFAGRPPLQADLIYNEDGRDILLSVINLHMKCCDSGLRRRQKAAHMLYEYLDTQYEKQPNIIVLGDWNDDTKDDPGEHCFDPFFQDHRFYFTTKDIAFDIKQASYPKEPYVSFLDHIMISEHLLPQKSSYDVQTILMGDFMGGYDIYETYISDHLPVILSFLLQNNTE
jgi:exonuclease III